MRKILILITIFISLLGHSQKVTKVNDLPLLQTKSFDGTNWLHPTWTQEFAQKANDSLVNVENLNCVEKLSVQLNGQESFVFFPSAVETSSLYYEDVNRGLDDFTVVRNSTATRVNDKNLIEEVGSHIARIDYSDATFIETEPESINLALHSEDFTDAVWVKSQVGVSLLPVVTADYGQAPDGTMTADRIVFDSNGSADSGEISRLIQSLTIDDGSISSIWVKSLTTSTFVTIYAGGSGLFKSVTTEWQRLNVYNPTGGDIGIGVIPTISEDVSDVLVWGGQASPTDELTRYVKTTTAIDGVPPLYDMEGCGVLLTENQSTNLITYSEGFSDASWTLGSNSVLTLESEIVSPDGSLGVHRLILSETGSTFLQFQTGVGTENYTGSIYVKKASEADEGFNLFYGGSPSQQFIPTNEWKRFSYNSSGNQFTIVNDGDTFVTDILIWGAQLEQLSYPTSYIKTEGSTVTRLKDEITNGGTVNDFNSEEGVLYCEISALSDDETERYIQLNDGTTSNRVTIRFSSLSSNDIRCLISSGGGTVASFGDVSNVITNFNKIAVVYALNRFELWVNGIKVGEDTTGNTPIGLDRLNYMGASVLESFYGKTKQIKVYKSIADAQKDLPYITN